MNFIRRMMVGAFLMEEDAGGGGGAPVATPPEPVAAPVAPAPTGDTPWSNDLASLIPDESIRGQVDGYLRQSWQPRVTQLEQQIASRKDAHELYDDLVSDPVGTVAAVAEQLFAENSDVDLSAIRAALGITETPPPAAAAPAQPVTDAQGNAVPPEMVEWWQNQERERIWNESLAPLREKDANLDDELLSPFVVTSGGDFEAAYNSYAAYNQRVAETLKQQLIAEGWSAPEGAPAPPPPPATLGASTGSAAPPPPPIQKKYATVDDAIDDAMADFRAAREAPQTI